ncbi:MAG: mechanosensitive ion channel domain-containing protein, partial [Planctomycetota bacterium]
LDLKVLTGGVEDAPGVGASEETAAPPPSSSSFDPTGLSLATGSSGDAPGGSDAPTVVTLADIGLALVIGFIAIVAFRNVPGLAEIFVLQRLPLDAASRFALATVLRYAIGFAGVLATAAVIGISWDKVQWLAAALTFGLAFGLQEIFANFVSGLIILAERPVRIGDTVTVGNVSGTVTKIRMRATTVTDWDRKELVIPNRQFITDQVINWTLSDPMLRVIVPVGVAYGSNIELVEKSLMEIGERNSIVLDTPKHYVLFRDFADSTLNFELRVFIPHIEHLLTVQHQLRVEIDRVFRERDIEIAFPQRDLHLRSADPIVEIAEHARGRADDGARS